jgi:hypothetical protein
MGGDCPGNTRDCDDRTDSEGGYFLRSQAQFLIMPAGCFEFTQCESHCELHTIISFYVRFQVGSANVRGSSMGLADLAILIWSIQTTFEPSMTYLLAPPFFADGRLPVNWELGEQLRRHGPMQYCWDSEDDVTERFT